MLTNKRYYLHTSSKKQKLGSAMVSALAALAMLSAKTLVQVPPMTSGVFCL